MVIKHSLYLGDDAPTDKKLIRIDEGLFEGTIYTYENIKLLEDDNEPKLNYDTDFYKVVVNGVDIELDNYDESMEIKNLIGEETANALYETVISPILINIIETQIAIEQLEGENNG